MSWQLLITISLFANIAQTLLQRLLLKNTKSDPAVYLVISNLIATVFLFIFAFMKGFSTENLINYIPNIILSMILVGIGVLFWFNSLKIIDASQFAVLFSSRALWIILAAVAVLGESFSFIQYTGAALILLAVYLSSWQSKGFKLSKGSIFALLAALFFGLGIVSDSLIIGNVDPTIYIPLAFFLPALFVWIINFRKTSEIISTLKSNLLPKFIVLSISSAVTATTYLTAYAVGKNASQLATINQTSTILVVLTGIIFLKERDNILKKIVAAIISFIGVLLVT
jgi:drug/metabolite transporter (DMT)-like permease